MDVIKMHGHVVAKLQVLPEQVKVERYSPGVDHGAGGVRLLQTSDRRELIFRDGHTGWVGRGARGYYGASLEIENPLDRISNRLDLETGGEHWCSDTKRRVKNVLRRSRAALVRNLEGIRKHMGLPFLSADVLDPNRTVSLTLGIAKVGAKVLVGPNWNRGDVSVITAAAPRTPHQEQRWLIEDQSMLQGHDFIVIIED